MSLLPAVVGTVALLVHWVIGPPLVLGLVLALILARETWEGAGRDFVIDSRRLTDLALAASLLVYLSGSYRLQGLVRQIFPADPRNETRPSVSRRLGRRWLAAVPRARDPNTVQKAEYLRLILYSPLFGLMGVVTCLYLSVLFPDPGGGHLALVWRAIVVIWAVGVGLIVAGGLFGYLRALRNTRDEALLLLQDELWRQTRADQGRILRWLMAAKLRRKDK
jgi:hypothetical protein